jgi:hypothetical protein
VHRPVIEFFIGRVTPENRTTGEPLGRKISCVRRGPGLSRHFLSAPGIKYSSGTILSGVKFDKRYWIFIAAAMIFSGIASASTLYMSSVNEHFRECNSVSAACFTQMGMVPCMVLGVLALLPVMIAIPYLFRQNEQVGVFSALVMGCIVLYTFLDAVNNISAIMHYQQTFLLAHAALSTTNNVTGHVVGTGESLC